MFEKYSWNIVTFLLVLVVAAVANQPDYHYDVRRDMIADESQVVTEVDIPNIPQVDIGALLELDAAFGAAAAAGASTKRENVEIKTEEGAEQILIENNEDGSEVYVDIPILPDVTLPDGIEINLGEEQ
mmetsp:Transcript_40847/g.46423  ORF Transcript_40847/g.46423 Transcript_40847/m.46423 type:complete len:128 (-) Transcript_40847:110-493(-)